MHGTADLMTDPEGSKALVQRARSTDKTLKLYDGLYHGSAARAGEGPGDSGRRRVADAGRAGGSLTVAPVRNWDSLIECREPSCVTRGVYPNKEIAMRALVVAVAVLVSAAAGAQSAQSQDLKRSPPSGRARAATGPITQPAPSTPGYPGPGYYSPPDSFRRESTLVVVERERLLERLAKMEELLD